MTPNDAKDEIRINISLRGKDAVMLRKLSDKARMRPGQFAKTLIGAALDREVEA